MNAVDGTVDPFLSVVVPVDGSTTEVQRLRETLLCLVGQDAVDFEVLVAVAAGTYAADGSAVDEVLADQAPRLATRIRLVRAESTSPGAVRNAALAEARGRYVTVLPVGDLVLGSWVARLVDSEAEAAGRLLRALAVTQAHTTADVVGHEAVRAVGSPRADSPARFSLWEHAVSPLSPPSSWAWPRDLAGRHGVRYDDRVVDNPDWELLVRAAQLVGVAEVGAVTSVHREWSTTSAPPGAADGPTAQEVIDSRAILVPAGEAALVRDSSSDDGGADPVDDELTRVREELRLTHDHARNLEGMVEHLQGTVEGLEARVTRLRAKLEAARSDDGSPQPQESRARGWRQKRQSGG